MKTDPDDLDPEEDDELRDVLDALDPAERRTLRDLTLNGPDHDD